MFGISAEGGASHDNSFSSDTVFRPQAKALGRLYNNAKHLYKGQQGLQNDFQDFGRNTVNPFMQGLNPHAMQGYGGLMGGGQQGQFAQQMNPALQQSLQQSLNGPQQPTMTQQLYQDIIGGPGNEYIQPVVDDMYNQAWQGLDRGRFRNNAQSAAASGNTGNYARQMDNATFAGDTMNNVRQQENALRAANYGQDMGWKQNIANLADTNASNERMQAQQGLLNMYGGADQNTQGALDQSRMMQQFGMGMMDPWMTMMQAPWNSLNNMANIIGDPTVLNNTTKKSGSWNAGISI